MNMTEMPLISVIVPVYGTEKYLRKCMDSILTQTYKNLEVIIVNDGTKDDSEKIIKEYLANDDRVKYVRHSKNRGLFQARISGAEEATGEYIAFVDSDDYLSIDWYRILVRKALETNADIVIADWAYEYENGKMEYLNLDNIRISDLDLKGEEITDAFMKQQGSCFSWHTVWNKIYSKKLWDRCASNFVKASVEKGHIIMCEDIMFSTALWFNADHVVNVHDITYFYCKHSNQSTNAGNDFKKYKKNITDVKFAFDFFEKIIKCKGAFEKYEKDFLEFKGFFARIWFEILEQFRGSSKARALYEQTFGNLSRMHTTTSDHFFESYKTELETPYKWSEEIKIAICDPDVEYVSFDIFDTLICRPFWVPADMFQLMETEFNKLVGSTSFITFKDIRTESENGCRRQFIHQYPSMEDITIDEIYRYMNEVYGFGNDVCEKLKELEISLEIKYCTTRKIGKELLELALNAGKKVVLISDMYLSADTVKRILDKNGITGYSEIFMSSEYRQLKYFGNLFKCFMEKYNVTDPDTVLHIGDNWTSDYEASKKLGMRAFHLPNAKEIFTNSNKKIYGGEYFNKIFEYCGNKQDNVRGLNNFLGMRCMLAMIANKIFDRGYVTVNKYTDFNVDPYNVGYMALGMHLLAVSDWLVKEQKKHSYEKIHFVARDGWLPKKAFEIVTERLGLNVNTDYFYISRKVTTPLQIRNAADLYSLKSTIYIFSFSPKKMINTLKSILDDTAVGNAEEICRKHHFIYSKNFNSESEYVRFLRVLMSEFYSEEKTHTFNDNVTTYLSEKIGENDAIFDIGYSVRSEAIFSHLLKRAINTYYIHTNQDIAFRRANMFNVNVNTFYDFEPGACVVLREHLFCELGPSCISYNVDGENVVPIFEEYIENYKMGFITRLIQKGALDFVKDFTDQFAEVYDDMIYRRFDASMPYEYFMCRAKRLDRQMFSECSFEDDMWQGKNSNFVEFWEGVLMSSKNMEQITEKSVEDTKFDNIQYKNMISYYYDVHRPYCLKTQINKSAMFMDKISSDDTLDDKFAKCAGNLNNVIEWEAAEKLISPLLIDNWYMTNPGGFSDGDFDVFLTTGLTEVHENADLTYLGKVLDKIGSCPLVPITVGFCTGTEKSGFNLGDESVKVLREIAERCKSIGVKGDYSAEVLKSFGINNIKIIGTPALYTNISAEKNISNSARRIDSVSASFKPFYGAFSEHEIELLKYFADNSFRLVCATPLKLDKSNIKDGRLLEKLCQYEQTKNMFFDPKEWADSFRNVDFAMGMNFFNNTAALTAGVPALFINYETIGRELCRFFGLPSIEIGQFDAKKSVEHYYRMSDYSAFSAKLESNFEEFKLYYSENGITLGTSAKRVIVK